MHPRPAQPDPAEMARDNAAAVARAKALAEEARRRFLSALDVDGVEGWRESRMERIDRDNERIVKEGRFH